MTREEAIEILKKYKDESEEDYYEKRAKALGKGIEALEQEPCEDIISRKAVLDYIYNDLGLGDEENGKDVERQMELEISYRYVKSLPYVTPQPKTGHWIETDMDIYECSECHKGLALLEKENYCPHCGAKMELKGE